MKRERLYLSLYELLNSFSLPTSLNNESAQYGEYSINLSIKH